MRIRLTTSLPSLPTSGNSYEDSPNVSCAGSPPSIGTTRRLYEGGYVIVLPSAELTMTREPSGVQAKPASKLAGPTTCSGTPPEASTTSRLTVKKAPPG